MVLVDTSVWIDHLRAGDVRLGALLSDGQVLTHPFVVGELACGNLRARRDLIALWQRLPQSPVASDDEVLRFIDRHALMGIGLGYLDAHLLASVALAPRETRLWTKDRRLATAAGKLGLA